MTPEAVYYELMWSDDNQGGIAYAPQKFTLYLHPNVMLSTNWTTPVFQLRRDSGPFQDFLDNSEGLPICSEKMRDILDSLREQTDVLEWLPVEIQDVEVTVTRNNAEQGALPGVSESLKVEVAQDTETHVQSTHRYYILHLIEELDVVNRSLSIMGSPDQVIQPYLDLSKVGRHRIFNYKGGGDMRVCLHSNIRRALIDADCTGCYFSPLAGS